MVENRTDLAENLKKSGSAIPRSAAKTDPKIACFGIKLAYKSYQHLF